MGKISVLIIEAHSAFLRSLTELLAGQPDIQVVGETRSAANAPDSMQTFAPDVVVLDISLTGNSGLAVGRQLKVLSPTTKIVILTGDDQTVYRRAVHDAGADALVKKAFIVTELIPCIRKVFQEESLDGIEQ